MSPFGRPMLRHWALDPTYTNLNHGTVGATPRPVLEYQQQIRDEIEQLPARFMLRELTAIGVGMPRSEPPRMRKAAAAVAEFLGARGEDLVFVDNATTGVNAVLRSYPFEPGDEILVLDRTYGSVKYIAGFVARERRATVREVTLPYPLLDPALVTRTILDAVGPKTRLAVIDHITSESALLLPVAEITAGLHAKRVAVLVDAAHAPGAVAVDVPSLGADWYVANLHKWAYAPRSSGILWAPPGRQSGLHPPVISWGLDQGFTAEFDLVGTRDPSPHLAAPEGIAFLRALGEDAVRAYNHELAWEAGRFLCEEFGTEPGVVAESLVGTMITVPLPASAGKTKDDANRLRDALLFEDRIEAQIHAWHDRIWVRLSAQVYNDMADVDLLARAILARQ